MILKGYHWNLLFWLCVCYFSAEANRDLKQFSIFNVVKFPNDFCIGNSNKNGTCYTAEECTSRSGLAEGTCAEGYGVCCIISLSCGGQSSENCTYMEMSSTSSPTKTDCHYKICPANSAICRVRFDFDTFVLDNPASGTVAARSSPATPSTQADKGGSIGDCDNDKFSVSNPSGPGTPVICGTNTNQHMYVDVGGTDCLTVNFQFGADSATRSYSVKALQYTCTEEMAGPPGCLQYFTATTGTVASFNFPTTATSVTDKTDVHLSNQNYDVCFRRALKKCVLCFIPSVLVTGATTTTSSSFGLSNIVTTAATTGSANINAKSQVDTQCSLDYIVIPHGTSTTTAATTASAGIQRYCGRVLSVTQGQLVNPTYAPGTSVCTQRVPFVVQFRTDQNEKLSDDATPTPTREAATAGSNEIAEWPAGIVGFKLDFVQNSC